MRIVLDTNVYISAIFFGGKAEAILKIVKTRGIRVFISAAILQEITEVLGRKFFWNNADIRLAVEEIQSWTTLVVATKKIALIKEKEPDNRILECAVEGEVKYIITGDKKHLLRLRSYRGMRIVSPTEFLSIVQQERL